MTNIEVLLIGWFCELVHTILSRTAVYVQSPARTTAYSRIEVWDTACSPDFMYWEFK